MQRTPAGSRDAAPPPGWLFLGLQLLGWALYAAALTAPWIGTYTLASMIPNKIVIAGSGLLYTSALRLAYREARRRQASGALQAALVVSGSIVMGFAWSFTASWVIGGSLPADVFRLGALGHPMPTLAGGLYHALVMLSWSLLYFAIRHYADLASTRERAVRAESLAREARLEALHYQVSPHFLFNALNAISSLVVSQRNAEASRTIARLADLLRLSLENPQRGMIPLRDELELVRRYVAVEEVRFGARLDVRFAIEAAAEPVPVPPMILQPLVENAVRYSVGSREGPSCITIGAAVVSGRLSLTLSDDGPGLRAAGPESTPARGLGVGLSNTRERLRAAYGPSHRFVLSSSPEGGVCVELDLPVATPDAA